MNKKKTHSHTAGVSADDVFVSYRREGGEDMAGRVADALRMRGFSVFMDVHDLKGGKFDEALLGKIEHAIDFVVILTPHCLDRCKDEEDWLRKEIKHALVHKRNIVPIMAHGFQMPKPATLPPDIADLTAYHGLSPTHELFDASIETLISKFLKAVRKHKDAVKVQQQKPEVWKKVLIGTTAALLVAFTLFVLNRLFLSQRRSIESVAVLPLRAEPANLDYLGEGLAEEIAKKLSPLPSLTIVPPSAFPDTGSLRRVQQIAKIDAVLEGKVLRDRDKLILDVSLKDIRDGSPIWSEHYNGDFSNVSVLIEEIALGLAKSLDIAKADSIVGAAATECTTVPEAFDRYLQARFLRRKHTPADNEQAILHYSEAIQRDSNCAVARVGLSNALVVHRVWPPYWEREKVRASRSRNGP